MSLSRKLSRLSGEGLLPASAPSAAPAAPPVPAPEPPGDPVRAAKVAALKRALAQLQARQAERSGDEEGELLAKGSVPVGEGWGAPGEDGESLVARGRAYGVEGWGAPGARGGGGGPVTARGRAYGGEGSGELGGDASAVITRGRGAGPGELGGDASAVIARGRGAGPGSSCSEELTPEGSLWRARTRFPAEHHHGRCPAGRAAEVSPELLALVGLDARLRECAPSRFVFLDTETTGLSGGTGTLPFLIGVGWFDRGELLIEQCVLRQPGEERPMLARLAARLSGASAVVTFNGKSFDWPLLRTRFVMNRMTPPALPPHLDLLHASRRVLKRRLTSTRLVEVEEGALGHRRQGDIDGSRIPELYFRFLRHRRLAALEPVLTHNVHDLVALAALAGWLVAGLEGAPVDARDALGFAELARRGGDAARALRLAALASDAPARDVAVGGLQLMGALLRRAGDAPAAVAALRRAVALGGASAVQASLHLELAKLLEHQLRDVTSALRHAERAGGAEQRGNLLRRLDRLRRKSSQGEKQLRVL